jgi:hypothetical protein
VLNRAEPVDVVIAPTVDAFVERYVRRERPVVVRGGLADWLPMQRWTLDHLKAAGGARRVKIGVSNSGVFVNYAERLNLGVDPEIAFAEVVDGIFSSSKGAENRRLHQEPLEGWGALDEESTPIRYITRPVMAKNIWMGSAGNVTKAHYDTEDNINVQLRGRKEFFLFPAAQLDALYPRSAWDYMSNFSRVDITAPDLARYPRFSRATPMRAVTEPGDFLYIPIYWWHQVHTLEASLNVNFWCVARTRQAMRWNGLRYWPRIVKDGYLLAHVARTLRGSIESHVRG